MSRPVGVRTSKKRAKTALVYTFAIEVRVSATSKLMQKQIYRALRQQTKHITYMCAVGLTPEPIRVRIHNNLENYIRETHQRYRQRVATEQPRIPRTKPGTR